MSLKNLNNMTHQFTAGKVYVEGCPFYDQTKRFERIATKYHNQIELVNPSLISLGKMTAGIALSFQTRSDELTLEVSLNERPLMSHMTACAQSGFDLYRLEDDGFLFIDVSRPSLDCIEYTYTFDLKNKLQSIKTYLLYFPLYNKVESLDLKTPDHPLIPIKVFNQEQILIYGTSITQGACASRPGLAYPALLERRLRYKCINFGFSGNGLGESVMVDLINDISNIKLIIIDYEANAAAAGKVFDTLKPMINKFRSNNINRPILILGRIPSTLERHDESLKIRRLNLTAYQNDLSNNLVYFVEGAKLLESDLGDTTIDNLHLNDLGFNIMSNKLYPIICSILNFSKQGEKQ